MKKIILSFILIFAVSIGIIPISYADSLIQLDERKIKLLEEYAMRIPYFYGDEVYSAQFARKSICLIYNGYAYRQGLKNGEFTALPLVGAARYIPQEDVNYEYRLIFGTDIPPNIQPNSAAMTYSGDLVYNTIFCNNEYEDKYILQTGDAPDDEYIYNNSISDGGNGLYVTINIEEHDGIVHGSSVLHILPRDNENGFIIVSHTKYLPQHDISINLNGQELYCEQKPIILEGCTLAPLRAIFEAFNFTVTYDTDFENFKYIITAINDKSKLQLKFDKSYEYTPNAINSHWLIYYTPKGKASKRLEFNVAPLIINGCTLVPVRVIAEALGADVSWNENTKQVTINGNIPNKWNKAENLNELSYNDLYTLIKSYCDKNGITSKSPMDLFDFEHGKGVLVSYGDSEKSYGISYYSDGYIEQNAAISLEQAHQKGKEIMQTEYLSECEKEGILKNWDEGIWNDYYKYENGEYWSENDNAYLIGYYAGHCWSGYAINKYLNEVTAMGLYQDLWETIIPGFYIKK